MQRITRPQLVLDNTDSPCTFEFDSPKYFAIFQNYGTLGSKEQKIIQVEPRFSKLNARLQPYKERVRFSVKRKDMPELHYFVEMEQNVYEINPKDHFAGVVDSGKDSPLQIHLGLVTVGKKVKSQVKIDNPLDVPLRLKFRSFDNDIEFDEKEIIIDSKSAITQFIHFTAQHREGDYEKLFKVHFSENVSFEVQVIYRAVAPRVSVTCKDPLTRNMEKYLSVLPFTKTEFKDITIKNDGELDLNVEIKINESNINQNPMILKPSQMFSPNIPISSTDEDRVIEDVSIEIFDSNNNCVKEFRLSLVVEIGVPRVECNTNEFEFQANDIGRKVEREVVLMCTRRTLQIQAIYCCEMGLKDDIHFPIKVEQGETKKFSVLIRPTVRLKRGQVTFVTNCEQKKKTFDIEYSINGDVFILCPKILDMTRRTHSSLVVANVSKKDNIISSYLDDSNCQNVKVSSMKNFSSLTIPALKSHMFELKKSDKPPGQSDDHLRFMYGSAVVCLPVLSNNSAVGFTTTCGKLPSESLSCLLQLIRLLLDEKANCLVSGIFPLIIKELSHKSLAVPLIVITSLEDKSLDMIQRCVQYFFPKDMQSKFLELFSKTERTQMQDFKEFYEISLNLCDSLGLYPLKHVLETTVKFSNRKKAPDDKDNPTDDKSNPIIIMNQYLCDMFEHYYSPQAVGTLESIRSCFNYKTLPETIHLIKKVSELLQTEPFNAVSKVSKSGWILNLIAENKEIAKENDAQMPLQKNIIDGIDSLNMYFQKMFESNATFSPFDAIESIIGEDIVVNDKWYENLIASTSEEKMLKEIKAGIQALVETKKNPTITDIFKLVKQFDLKCNIEDGFFDNLVNKDETKAFLQFVDNEEGKLITSIKSRLSKYSESPSDYKLESEVKFVESLLPNVPSKRIKNMMDIKKCFVKFSEAVDFDNAIMIAQEIFNSSDTNLKDTIVLTLRTVMESGESCMSKTIDSKELTEIACKHGIFPKDANSEKHFENLDYNDIVTYQAFLKDYKDAVGKKTIALDMLQELQKKVTGKKTVIDLLARLNQIKKEDKLQSACYHETGSIFLLFNDKYLAGVSELAEYCALNLEKPDYSVSYQKNDYIDIDVNILESLIEQYRNIKPTSVNGKIRCILRQLSVEESVINKVLGVVIAINEIPKEAPDKALLQTAETICQITKNASKMAMLGFLNKFYCNYEDKLENVSLEIQANDFLCYFAHSNLKNVAEVIKLLYSHCVNVNALGFQILEDVYDVAENILNSTNKQSPSLSNIMNIGKSLHTCGRKNTDCQNSMSPEVLFLQWFGKSGFETCDRVLDVVKLSEFLLINLEMKNESTLQGIIELLCNLSFIGETISKAYRCVAQIQTSLSNKKKLVKCLKETAMLETVPKSLGNVIKAMSPIILIRNVPNLQSASSQSELFENVAYEVFVELCTNEETKLKLSCVKNYNLAKEHHSKEHAIDFLFDVMKLVRHKHSFDYGSEFWKAVMQLSDEVDLILDKVTVKNMANLVSSMTNLAKSMKPNEEAPIEELFMSVIPMVISKNHTLKVSSSLAFYLVALKYFERSNKSTNSEMHQLDDFNFTQMEEHCPREESAAIKISVVSLPKYKPTKDLGSTKPVIVKTVKSVPTFSSCNDLSEKKLDDYARKIKEDIELAVGLFDKVQSSEIFTKLTTYAVRISAVELASILHRYYKAYEKVKVANNLLMFYPNIIQLSTDLPKALLKLIVDMWRTLHEVQMVWNARKINGNFDPIFKKLQDEIKNNINTLIDKVNDKDQELLKTDFESVGMKLTRKLNVCYNYEIDEEPLPKRIEVKVDNSFKNSQIGTLIPGTISFFEIDSNIRTPYNPHISRMIQDSENGNVIRENLDEQEEEEQKPMSNKSNKPEKKIKRGKYDGHRIVSENELDLIKRKQFSEDWLKELNEIDVSKQVANNEASQELVSVGKEKLKYHFLAELTRPFQSNCIKIMTEIKRDDRNDKTHIRTSPDQRQMYKFLFLIDYSGSMNGEKKALALNILIVLLECMKKMEYETAVVTFSGEESQVVLKDFQDEMVQERGQYIIEALSNPRGKTLPLDALRFVAEKQTLYSSSKESNEHRFIVLITDGIWQQTDCELYEKYKSKAGNANLLILTTHPSKDKSSEFFNESVSKAENILDIIAKEQWLATDPEKDLGVQVECIACLIDDNLREIAKRLRSSKMKLNTSFEIVKDKFEEIQNYDKMEDYQNVAVTWGKSKFVSYIDKNSQYDSIDTNFKETLQNQYEDCLGKYADHLQDFHTIENLSAVDKRSKAITKAEANHEDLIWHLGNVLDSFVFPDNRPTRNMLDYRGACFSTRGYIKFICTDGQFKKIYENRIGHPRKDYMVSIILDVSNSMAGMTEVGCVQVFLSLTAALHNSNVNFSLYTAGKCTRLIKNFDEEWNDLAKAKVYDALTFTDNESNLSDAIFFACQHSRASGRPNVEKTIFVMTDGFPSAPKKLQASLSYADSLDVFVVALGVGLFTEGIFHYFKNFIVVNNPMDLPSAIQNFYNGEPKLEGIHEAIGKMAGKVIFGDKLKTLKEVWAEEMKLVYKDQTDKLENDLRLATTNRANEKFIVDLCFVLDTTGSMKRYIDMAKTKIKQITENIRKQVSETYYSDTELRLGYVAYKARGNAGHLNKQPFTDDVQKVLDVVSKEKAGGGGWTYWEDKEDAIVEAKEFEWKGEVKFLVLIGDQADYGSRGTMKKTIKDISEKEIHMLYVSISTNTDEERKMMKQVYCSTNSKTKDTGFKEIDMKEINQDTDKLSELIAKEIIFVIETEFM